MTILHHESAHYLHEITLSSRFLVDFLPNEWDISAPSKAVNIISCGEFQECV